MEKTIHILQTTHQKPFCAGILIRKDDQILVTLNPDGIPSDLGTENYLRIGLVGGGQEPEESILECAIREAKEELSIQKVQIRSARSTYFYENNVTQFPIPITCLDEVAPFFFLKTNNPDPINPYKPNLPVGPDLYFALYEADVDLEQILPGDDVAGLLWVPIERLENLTKQPTLETLLDQGCELIENLPLDRKTCVFFRKDESLSIITPLLTNTMRVNDCSHQKKG